MIDCLLAWSLDWLIDWHWLALNGIDWHWLALIGIDWHRYTLTKLEITSRPTPCFISICLEDYPIAFLVSSHSYNHGIIHSYNHGIICLYIYMLVYYIYTTIYIATNRGLTITKGWSHHFRSVGWSHQELTDFCSCQPFRKIISAWFMGSQLKTKGAEFSNQLLMTLSQNVDTPSSSNRLKGENWRKSL